MMIEIHHGALADPYEEQVAKYGLTYGEHKKFVEDIGFGIVAAHMYECITDSEYDKILRRFHKNILLNKDFLKRKEGDANDD